MAIGYETGTATGRNDLLAKIRTFALTNADLVTAGQNWTEARYDTVSEDHELILKGTGIAGQDSVYIGYKTFNNPAMDTSGVTLIAAPGFDEAEPFTNQPGANSTTHAVSAGTSGMPERIMFCWEHPMQYWLIGNGRRIVMVVKVGTSYHASYVGMFLPYYSPSEYPYPLMVGGTGYDRREPWNSTVNGMSNFTDPKPVYDASWSSQHRDWSSLCARLVDGTWVGFQNHYGGINETYCNGQVLPSRTYYNHGEHDELWEDKTTVLKNSNGTVISPPTAEILFVNRPFRSVLGEMDQVYFTVGRYAGVEKELTDGNTGLLKCFPNIFRHGPPNIWSVRVAE